MKAAESSDYDALTEGATPDEARQLRKVLAEWCRGDEGCFTVQHALFTKAQLRASARVPTLVKEATKILEARFVDFERRMIGSEQRHAVMEEAMLIELQKRLDERAQEAKALLGELRTEKIGLQRVVTTVRDQLTTGSKAWESAKADLVAEQKRLAELKDELERRDRKSEHVLTSLILLGAVACGIAIGWMAHS